MFDQLQFDFEESHVMYQKRGLDLK